MGLPTFHGMGLLLQLAFPLAFCKEVAVYTPQDPAPPVIPHAQNVYEVSKMMGCNAVFALPSYVEVCLGLYMSVTIVVLLTALQDMVSLT